MGSVQNLEDKVRNIQDRAAKTTAKKQNIRSQSRVSALASSQKVKLLFGKVAAAEATVRKNRAKTDQSKLALQGKNKAAQKVDREQQNMLTTLAKAETALAQASDVKQAKQAKDFLVTVRKQVLAVQKMKSASDAEVTIAQKGLESTTQAEQDSKAVVVGLKNELSGHASDATRHQMQVAKITASMAAAKLTNAKEAQEATKEALDTASSAGDKTSADRIQAIASTLAKKVVKDEEKKAKADSKEAQAEVAANDDIKEKAKAASNQATFKGQAVALKAKLKKLLDQTKVNPKAVKKAVQNLNGIADETKGAIAGAAKEKRKERKLVKKLEKEADGQIKEKVEVAVLEQPELPKAKIKKALEKKAKEIVEEELARGKKPTSQQVMKQVMGKAKDSESEAKKVAAAAAAAASASGQKTQAKGQNSQSSSVRQDADNVAAAKKKAADAATKLAEVSTQLAKAQALEVATKAEAQAASSNQKAEEKAEVKAEEAASVEKKLGVEDGAKSLANGAKATEKTAKEALVETNNKKKAAEAAVEQLKENKRLAQNKAIQAKNQVVAERQSERAAAEAAATKASQAAQTKMATIDAKLKAADESQSRARKSLAQAQKNGDKAEIKAATDFNRASTAANAKAKDLFDREKIAADKAKLALVRAQAEAKEARQVPKPDGQAQAQRLDAAEAKSASEAADKQVPAAQQAEQKRVVENETKKINLKKAIREKADPKVVDNMTKAAQRQAEKLAQAKAETADAETKQSVKAQKAKEKQEEANGTETKEAIKQVEAANQEVVREEKDLQKVKEKKAAGVEKGEEAQKSEEWLIKPSN